MTKDLFYQGKDALMEYNLDLAQKKLARSFRENANEKSLDYLLYIYLIRSDFGEMAKILSRIPIVKGFSLYSQYWLQFMSGEMLDTDDILLKMLPENNFFLRVFAFKELTRMGKNTGEWNLLNLITSDLTYELPLEEQRGTILLDRMKGSLKKALDDGKALIQQNPDNGDVYLDWMETVALTKDFGIQNEVLTHSSVTRMIGKDYRVMYQASKMWYQMGDIERSRIYLQKLVGYFKHNPLFYFNLGNIYLSKKNYVRAVIFYDQAIAAAPLFERAFYNRGIAFFRLGELEKAIENFKEAVHLDKKSESIYNLSICLIEKKELQSAYYCLDRLPSNYPAKQTPELIKSRIRDMAVYT